MNRRAEDSDSTPFFMLGLAVVGAVIGGAVWGAIGFPTGMLIGGLGAFLLGLSR